MLDDVGHRVWSSHSTRAGKACALGTLVGISPREKLGESRRLREDDDARSGGTC